MNYLLDTRCFSDQDSYFSAVAAKCPLTLDNGDLVSCVPTLTGVDITYTNPVTLISNTYPFIPPSITCPNVLSDVVSVAWQVVVVWVIAWGIRTLYRQL